MYEVKVKCVIREPLTKRYVLILESIDGTYYIPITIGMFEAEAIYTEISDIKSPRPLTYDFFSLILENIGDVTVDRIIIYDKSDDVFKAKIVLNKNGIKKEIDCRPSDAIALGLRLKSSIFVEDVILKDKKCIKKDCIKKSDKMILEHIITDQATTYWNV
ncbi:MAG: uncharacterized protein PWQ25_541 [Deferribacteres bacterium]|jgi:bifunctional DNase/RNase|nr:uncharacterized protein [Deferribacteres bacterium]